MGKEKIREVMREGKSEKKYIYTKEEKKICEE
jgi:hypothetical protein